MPRLKLCNARYFKDLGTFTCYVKASRGSESFLSTLSFLAYWIIPFSSSLISFPNLHQSHDVTILLVSVLELLQLISLPCTTQFGLNFHRKYLQIHQVILWISLIIIYYN